MLSVVKLIIKESSINLFFFAVFVKEPVTFCVVIVLYVLFDILGYVLISRFLSCRPYCYGL